MELNTTGLETGSRPARATLRSLGPRTTVPDHLAGRPPARWRGVRPTATAISFDPLLPLESWTALGTRIGLHANASSWWLGDWLLFGRMKYGRSYKDAVARTGLDYQTLRNYAVVARRFQPSRRRADVTFQHHAEVAALTDELQDLWLQRAAAGGWSKQELRRRLRAARGADSGPITAVSVRVPCHPERARRWSDAARRDDCTLDEWIERALDAASEPPGHRTAAVMPCRRPASDDAAGVTATTLEAHLQRFGWHHIIVVAEVAQDAGLHGLDPALLLALGSRETSLLNVVGDAGHGRGWLQIDDRVQAQWLDEHAGCEPGSWTAAHRSALPRGRVPTLAASTLKTCELLLDAMEHGRAHGIDGADLVRFACAAFDAGDADALAGARAGDVDLHTSRGDYSADVLSRRGVIAHWLQRGGMPAAVAP